MTSSRLVPHASRLPVTIVAGSGDLGVRQARDIAAAIAALIDHDQKTIVVDFKDAETIDLLAAAGICEAAAGVLRNGGQIKFARTGVFIRAFFQRFGLGNVIEIYKHLEDAIASFDEEWSGALEVTQ